MVTGRGGQEVRDVFAGPGRDGEGGRFVRVPAPPDTRVEVENDTRPQVPVLGLVLATLLVREVAPRVVRVLLSTLAAPAVPHAGGRAVGRDHGLEESGRKVGTDVDTGPRSGEGTFIHVHRLEGVPSEYDSVSGYSVLTSTDTSKTVRGWVNDPVTHELRTVGGRSSNVGTVPLLRVHEIRRPESRLSHVKISDRRDHCHDTTETGVDRHTGTRSDRKLRNQRVDGLLNTHLL